MPQALVAGKYAALRGKGLLVAEEPKGDTQVNVPAIIAELGFMTNPTEDRLLGTHRPTDAVRLLDSAAGPLRFLGRSQTPCG